MSTPSVTILKNIAGIAKSSEGHPGGCPFSLAFWSRPAGSVKARGRCGNGDSWAAFPPFQQPAGRARNPPAIESVEKPSTWRKRELTCRGFQHSDRLRVSLGTLRPSKC